MKVKQRTLMQAKIGYSIATDLVSRKDDARSSKQPHKAERDTTVRPKAQEAERQQFIWRLARILDTIRSRSMTSTYN